MPALKMALYVVAILWSGASAVVLFYEYLHRRIRLLMWNAIFLAGLTANNVALVIEVVTLPELDLRVARLISLAIGTACLVYGLVWDAK